MKSLREIRRRISSVQKTQKITEAMQKVASAKLHRAQSALGYVLPYEERLRNILLDFVHEGCASCRGGDFFIDHPCILTRSIDARPVKRVSIVFVASHTGLCGAYNSNMERKLHDVLEDYAALPQDHITLYPIGQKMREAVKDVPYNVSDSFVNLAEGLSIDEAVEFTQKLMSLYLKEETDKVELIYYHFRSMASQVISRDVFLPFQALPEEALLRMPDTELKGKHGRLIPQEHQARVYDPMETEGYLAEPDGPRFLDALLPHVLNYRMYLSLLDAQASEHAARALAMRTASENAEDILKDLRLQYNKSRQQAITREILDIVQGTVR
ncbi:MAG: ATP synthase F1 subunit gamma [Bacteroidales bacterium]|jgi:F-type H+-transporting ATPase subunit gamma|nr:ATP synthase F1 subunit gamma [Bacteroidales bacterium]HHV40715.1 ATP synthase F1 subunit gamma [Bacteroidales bacterium]